MGFGVVNFSYNTLSGFLSVIIMLMLFRGLLNNKLMMVAISGILTGLSMFASLPTITIAAQLLTILFYQTINSNITWKSTIRSALLYCGGIMLSVSAIILLMKYIGHFDIYKKAIQSITNHAVASDSNHNLLLLAKKYAKDYLHVTKMGLLWVSFTAALGFIKPLCNKTICSILWYTAALLFNIFVVWNNPIFITYFLAITSTLILAINSNQKIQTRVIAFGAFVTAFFLPLGTDPGIHSIGHSSMWVSLPFFFFAIRHLKEIDLRISSATTKISGFMDTSTIKLASIIFISAFFLVKSFQIANGAYFDPGSRFHKTSLVNSDLSQNIYTTMQRASIINHILEQTSQIVKPNDYLLVYDKFPVLHYLTETRPYVYNPWVWAYDSYNFKQQLLRAESEIKTKPYVIVQKFETIMAFSPPTEDYLNENRPDSYLNRAESHKALKEFLTRNKYTLYLDDEYFSIYEPEL
ncbi:hypothetical protein KEM09_01005 [Carboxylicivirga mesophila]|uniref:Glycosyltransferase RgtA/B/C/D-like domain-containing protein n=1 Tax=Carboxylicivirga mesophila TaxID=1166478 RepID=A0ABS5K4M3_9BACT|nr:hypothetical protein [Carboxylicivirga mesophila]MBS2209962.1 hypothetical protein [Carboxylicivirga mesophila]